MGDCKTCTGCKEKKENKIEMVKHEPVPHWAFEGTMARSDSTIKRLIVALIVAIALMFAINIAWIWVFNSYDYSSVTEEQIIEAEQDGEGINIVGGGNIDYGADSTDSHTESDTNQN